MKNIIIATIIVTLLSGSGTLAARFCLDVGPELVVLINKPLVANPILDTGKSSCQLHGNKPNID